MAMKLIKTLEKTKRVHFSIQGNRIRCTLTGHELPPSADALLAYANGKKFERALSNYAAAKSAAEAASDQLEKFLISAALVERAGAGSKGGKDDDEEEPKTHRRLFCQLTCRFLADTPADMARHLRGRRFTAALQAYRAARAEGREFEPNTSHYRKYRSRMTLEGLAGAGGDKDKAGVRQTGGEDAVEAVEDEDDSRDEAEETDDAEEEMVEDSVEEEDQESDDADEDDHQAEQVQQQQRRKRLANENGDGIAKSPDKRRRNLQD